MVSYSNPATIGATANIAACDVPYSASYNYREGRIYQVANDNLPYETWSRNYSSWTASRTTSWLPLDYGNKDGIAATSWFDSRSVAHVRLYYPNGGNVKEYGSDNWNAWYAGYVFPST